MTDFEISLIRGFIFNLKRRPLALFCLIIISAVFLYVHLDFTSTDKSASLTRDSVTVTGSIYDKKINGDNLLVYIKNGYSDDIRLNVICYFSYDEDTENYMKIGSYVSVKGTAGDFKTATNPGEFDLKKYYRSLSYDMPLYKCSVTAISEEYSKYREFLYNLKSSCIKMTSLCFCEKDGSVIGAMLFGDKASLDKDIKDLYQSGGISHVLAISGLHISFFGMMVFSILNYLRAPRIINAGLSIFFVISYGYMTGMGISVYRAAFMFILTIVAKIFKRTYDSLTALALAGLSLVIINPLVLQNAGFYLSFMAVIGIRTYSVVFFRKKDEPDLTLISKVRSKVISSFLSCLSVSLFTFPIISYFYYEYPPYSVFINILVIPLMGLLLVCSLITVVLGFIYFPIVKIPAFICHIILRLYEKLCSISLSLPFSKLITGHPKTYKVFLYFLICTVLTGITLYNIYHEDDEHSENNKIHIFLTSFTFEKRFLIACLLPVILIVIHTGSSVTMLDIGQGDSLCINNGSTVIMVDGGSSDKKEIGNYIIEPYIKYRGYSEISYWILTHPDADHINGLEELLTDYGNLGIRIDNIILPDAAGINEDAANIVSLANANNINLLYLKRGDVIKSKDMTLTFLNPEKGYSCDDKNEYSLVFLLEYKGMTGLFTGDATKTSETNYIVYAKENGIDLDNITFYKAAHHGSDTSSAEETVNLLSPSLTLISCGLNNSYGHPSESVVNRLLSAGSDLYITTECGAITLQLSGDRIRINPFIKKAPE